MGSERDSRIPRYRARRAGSESRHVTHPSLPLCGKLGRVEESPWLFFDTRPAARSLLQASLLLLDRVSPTDGSWNEGRDPPTLRLHAFLQPSPELVERDLLVPQLAPLLLARHDDPGWQMAKPDGRLAAIHALPTRPARAERLDLAFSKELVVRYRNMHDSEPRDRIHGQGGSA